MHAGKLLAPGIWKRSTSAINLSSAGSFGLGLFLGIIAVSMWQQWSLTFGRDPVLLLIVSLVISGSFWIGQRWQSSPTNRQLNRALSDVLLALCGWSMLHPFWVDALTKLMGYVPISWMEQPTNNLLLGLAIAILGWMVPGTMWAAAITLAPIRSQSSSRITSSMVISGIATGLLLNSVVFSPWTGVYVPNAIACVITAIASVWIRWTVSDVRSLPPRTEEMQFPDRLIPIRIGMACLIGALVACNLRLINQLMPHGAFVLYAQVAGLLAGISVSYVLTPPRPATSNRAAWGGLFAAAISTFLLAVQPLLVDLSLWMNSTLTNVFFLMAARVALLMVTTIPFGVALVWITDTSRDGAIPRFVGWGTPFLGGIAGTMFLLGGTVEVVPMMIGCGGLLLFASAFARASLSFRFTSFRATVIAGCLLTAALSLPIWRTNDDASRTAKVLFSTPAFVAYRSGWKLEELPALDDVRLIHRREGSGGSLTLWRGRVAELYVREAGIPRSVLTNDPEIVPQFAPEVLQAVYPLLMLDRPNRILLLGLSAGIPLSTCLGFPIREAVCIEGDSSLVDFVRGPLARETGVDPLADDRVTLKRVSPELALMAQSNDRFDVILSSPSCSAMTGGAPSFTREFYQRAASQLSDRGMFCQRFECIDYGPEPLRIVVKSMRQAFQRVVAIETASGELLLLGAHSDDVFTPDDLAARLERPHVLRILARSGLDWSTLLNHPAYDHEALGEVCDDSRSMSNSIFNGLLAARAPMEVMRWGNKLQETQTALTATRLSKAPFWSGNSDGEPNMLENEIHLTRRSRLVEWLGDSRVSRELLRRLQEVSLQQKLVRENPDAHWWEYRNVLKQELQDRPRTLVQQVKAVDEKRVFHPEDIRRRDYFIALGNAARRKNPTREQIAAVEEFIEPYDPLLSYFARQEVADMLARCDEDAALELAYRLHVIYFAPTRDSSVRNVATAIETLVKHPEAMRSDSARFDALNGLLQTLRVRWETRQFISETSSTKVLEDVDQSLIAVEKGVAALDQLVTSSAVDDADWETRKHVIERLLLRPLRSYRAEVKSRQLRSQTQAKLLLKEAEGPEPEGEQKTATP